MSIRKYFTVYSIASGVLLLTLGTLVAIMLGIQYALARSEEHRLHSYQLAMELFQSSEDLTRMARSYVTTGDSVYEERYFAILDIRNGNRSRPTRYDPTFWHLGGNERGSPIVEGEAVPLDERFVQEGISATELTLLRTSQRNSDHLVLMEKRAFAAMKGIYEDRHGNFTIRGPPDQRYAIELLFSREYDDEKASIMQPIQDFMTELDRRTRAEVTQHEVQLRRYTIGCLILIAGLLALSIRNRLYSYRRILNPLQVLRDQVGQIKEGNYTARSEIESGNEIQELGERFNEMADALEEDIHRRSEITDILRRSESSIQVLYESTGEAIYGINLDGVCTFANPACARILGFASAAHLVGKNMHDLIHHTDLRGESLPIERCNIHAAIRKGQDIHVDDEVFFREDGTAFPVEYRAFPHLHEGEVIGAVVTFNDITERKDIENSLILDRNRLTNILAGTNVGTWEWNVQTGEVFFNERWADIIGYTLGEMEPISIDTWVLHTHPEDLEVSGDALDRHFRGEASHYECEARMRHREGHWVWVLDRGKVTEWTEDGRPLLMAGTHTDITNRKKEEERIRHLATHDTLTELPNLRLAHDRLQMAMRNANRHSMIAAILFVDLDNFKPINDNFGHGVGDEVLKEVAGRLRLCVRDTDTVARIGGDEFLVIITDLNSGEAAGEIAAKLVAILSDRMIIDDHELAIGCSIGVALYPINGKDPDALIRIADEAMYRVKHGGKNGFRFGSG